MGDPTSTRASFRNKFELEKFHFKFVMEASPSNCSQKQKATEIEEIVKHMKHLPSFLERGKPIPDRALSFGVIDWARLEKWQYKHHNNGLVRSRKCSPSSSNSSSLFSTDGSSPRSTRDQSCSPARQKGHRVTLQSQFEASPKEDFTGDDDNFQYVKDLPEESKSLLVMKSYHTPPTSCSKGKLKIRDESFNGLQNIQDLSRGTSYDDDHPKSLEIGNSSNPRTFQSEAVNGKNPQRKLDFSRNQSSPTRNNTPERKKPTSSSKNSDSKPRSISPLRRFSCSHSTSSQPESPTKNSDSKPRSISPLRRFSCSLSTSSQPESPISRRSTTDTNWAHSSPLRRLFDPILPSKTHEFSDTCHENSRTKVKTKLNFKKEFGVGEMSSSSRKQALFQTTVKNDRLLFTLAVENNKEILAATVTNLSPAKFVSSSSRKQALFQKVNLLYTFFTVHEVKKKNVSWLSHGSKSSKDHGYVPNVTAQMKVSNSHRETCEYVLYSVNPNVEPQDELGTIVVKFSGKEKSEDDQVNFSTIVILPGGSHGVPSKGEPSPLIDRWRSGGVCDCGGWDLGCSLTTLSNNVHSSGSRSDKVQMTACQFELFGQGEIMNKRPIFSLSPLKEGIFSVDYNSSLSPVQAFSICISVVESRKMSQHKQLRSLAHEDVPLIYTPIPRIKRSTICINNVM